MTGPVAPPGAFHEMDEADELHAPHHIDKVAVLRALHDVDDPELPISIVDLGLVDAIDIADDAIRVRLLPTFSGCPALGQIATRARARLEQLTNGAVEIAWSRAGQWTPDRIAPGARAALTSYGVGCTAASAPLPACPSCASPQTQRVSHFGSSLCRSSFRCTACGNRFEALKAPGIAARRSDAVPVPASHAARSAAAIDLTRVSALA